MKDGGWIENVVGTFRKIFSINSSTQESRRNYGINFAVNSQRTFDKYSHHR